MLNRGANGKGRRWQARLRQSRVDTVKLSHFSKCPPTKITRAGTAEVAVRGFFELLIQAKSPGNFVTKSLVLNKPIFVSRSDCFFVQSHRIHFPAFDPGKLRRQQQIPIEERPRATFGPFPKPLERLTDHFDQFRAAVWSALFIQCCSRKGGIKEIVSR